MKLTQALKEWAVAVEALESAKTIMLLRKGGIREQGGRFTVAQDQVLLYPTYEHQQPHLLKPAYSSQIQPVLKAGTRQQCELVPGHRSPIFFK